MDLGLPSIHYYVMDDVFDVSTIKKEDYEMALEQEISKAFPGYFVRDTL